MMEMIAAYLQQNPLVAAMGESMENKDWALLASAHKMIPSFSIMGISSEYEDMAKKSSYSGDLEDRREEIDSLVLQLQQFATKPVKN
jgi:hypothetical protein